MNKEEKIQTILLALAEKAEELAEGLRDAAHRDDEGMRNICIFLEFLKAQEINNAMEILHKEVNLI